MTFDLETLATRGPDGVVDGWLTTAVAAQEAGASLSEQPLIHALLPDLLAEREALAIEVAELDAAMKGSDARNDDQPDAEDGADDDGPTPEQLKELKGRRTKAKKALRLLDASLLESAAEARSRVDAHALVLDLLRARLQDGLERRVSAHRRTLVARYETWHAKYAVTLRQLEAQLDAAAQRLDAFLQELGYE